MMIAFITIKSSLVPLIEGLCAPVHMYQYLRIYMYMYIYTVTQGIVSRFMLFVPCDKSKIHFAYAK